MMLNDIKSITINSNKFIRNITSNMKIVDTKHVEYYVLQNQSAGGAVNSIKDVLFKSGQLHNTNEVIDGYTYTTDIKPLFTAADENGEPWIIAYAKLSRYNPHEGGGGSNEVIFFKANDVKLDIGG